MAVVAEAGVLYHISSNNTSMQKAARPGAGDKEHPPESKEPGGTLFHIGLG
jgi:hypothetical protein